MALSTVLHKYYHMTKPGIIRGNIMMLAAGYLLAAGGNFQLVSFLTVLIGTTLVIASACVANNYIDRSIDEKMERTKKRALVTGVISPRNAIIYAIVLGVIGFFVLLFTNLPTFLIGVTAYVFYVVIYGIAKRASYHGTLVGAIPGALPLVAGYVAVTASFDIGALLLFLIFFLWQIPHFYAIAIYRRNDYQAAGIPVISVVLGVEKTKRAIMWYILAFMLAVICLSIMGYTGLTYLFVMLAVGTAWFVLGLRGFKTHSNDKWGRTMFRFSLIVSLIFSVMIAVDNLLI